jgi:hypothetical protein
LLHIIEVCESLAMVEIAKDLRSLDEPLGTRANRVLQASVAANTGRWHFWEAISTVPYSSWRSLMEDIEIDRQPMGWSRAAGGMEIKTCRRIARAQQICQSGASAEHKERRLGEYDPSSIDSFGLFRRPCLNEEQTNMFIIKHISLDPYSFPVPHTGTSGQSFRATLGWRHCFRRTDRWSCQ